MIRRAAVAVLDRVLLSGFLVALLVFAAGWVYTQQQPTSYTATTVLTLVPRPEDPVSAATAVLLAESYRTYLSSGPVAAGVAAGLGRPAAAVAAGTEVEVEPDTAIVEITVKLATADDAAAVANAVGTAAVGRGRSDPNVTVDLVSPAVARAVEVNPPRGLMLVLAALAALVVGGGTCYLLVHRGPRAREREEPR